METVLSVANVPEYPKIETLYDRDEKFKVVPGRFRLPEFAAVGRWNVTEKIDGTNIRIAYVPPATSDEKPSVFIGGRTNDAQLPPHLRQMLTETFTMDRLMRWVRPDTADTVTIYGEGYGAKIQKGGGNYRATPGFRAFDIRIGNVWLDRDGFFEACEAMGIQTAPLLKRDATTEEAIALVQSLSKTAAQDGGPGCEHEGVIAASSPPMLTRLGDRIIWKLKRKDFA